MVRNLLVTDIQDTLSEISCLEPSPLSFSFLVKNTDKRFMIILESSPLFNTFPMDPRERFFHPSKISFLRFDAEWDGGFNYYRISPETFLEVIPEEARAEFLFHLDLFRAS